jgi:hypothetical protein
MRVICTTVVLVLFAIPAAWAGDDGVSGNWKMSIFEDGQQLPLWLVTLESKGGKLTGAIEPLRKVPPSSLSDVKLTGDRLTFTIKLGGQPFGFEGKLPQAGGKKILGSFSRGPQMIPAMLEATKATTAFEVDKELATKTPADPRAFTAVLDLIKQANAKKVDAKEVKNWVEKSLQAAENYGPRWQLETALRLADTLLAQEGFATVAVDAALAAEKVIDPKADAEAHIRLLSALASALRKADRAEEAKKVETRMAKPEGQAYQEYQKTSLPFAPEKAKERKKGDRAVLVELFTGAQCPPCVAADLAFDAVEKTYKPAEVVLLQYHLHIPGPDALTNADAEARQEYYGQQIRGTPSIFFNGKPAAGGGGTRDDAADKYKEYCDTIDPLRAQLAPVKLQASAIRKGDKLHIKANADAVDKPGKNVRLRLALIEEWVRYRGRNGLSYHHRVVRALPGGAEGLALTKKEGEQSAVVDLEDLRKRLNKYLDDFARNEAPFPDAQRPMAFRNLSVVAFVQNDDTKEVLQAIEVPVKGGDE